MKLEDFNKLKELVSQWDTPENRGMYIEGRFPRAEVTKDVDMRYRWDLFYQGCNQIDRNSLYEYLNDNHIDTALRKIVKPLKG